MSKEEYKKCIMILVNKLEDEEKLKKIYAQVNRNYITSLTKTK